MNCIVVESSLFQRQILVQSAHRSRRFTGVLGVAEELQALESLDAETALVMVSWELADQRAAHLLHAIRAHAQFGDTPLVVVSNHESADRRETATSLGADAFLSRPFSPAEFQDAICGALNRNGSPTP